MAKRRTRAGAKRPKRTHRRRGRGLNMAGGGARTNAFLYGFSLPFKAALGLGPTLLPYATEGALTYGNTTRTTWI